MCLEWPVAVCHFITISVTAETSAEYWASCMVLPCLGLWLHALNSLILGLCHFDCIVSRFCLSEVAQHQLEFTHIYLSNCNSNGALLASVWGDSNRCVHSGVWCRLVGWCLAFVSQGDETVDNEEQKMYSLISPVSHFPSSEGTVEIVSRHSQLLSVFCWHCRQVCTYSTGLCCLLAGLRVDVASGIHFRQELKLCFAIAVSKG